MIYKQGQNKFKVPTKHDPDSVITWTIPCIPDAWQANTVYEKRTSSDYDIVIPTTFKGLMYIVDNPGMSGATEPNWELDVDSITDDFQSGETSGLTWKAVSYALFPTNKTISSVSVTATNGVDVSSTNNAKKYTFTIDAISSGAAARLLKKFEVKAHIVLSDGDAVDRTFEFKLAEQ